MSHIHRGVGLKQQLTSSFDQFSGAFENRFDAFGALASLDMYGVSEVSGGLKSHFIEASFADLPLQDERDSVTSHGVEDLLNHTGQGAEGMSRQSESDQTVTISNNGNVRAVSPSIFNI